MKPIFLWILALPLFFAVQAWAACPLFPANNVWNTPIDQLPLDPRSSAYINSIGANTGLHPDFGSGTWDGGPIGIPYNTVSGDPPKVSVAFDYADESDTGPYPIPSNPVLEYGSDHHLLILDEENCVLYETWDTRQTASGAWEAGSGAIFDLRSNALRPAGWTSADAAGLPILPGLARCAEIATGAIRHALRFTAERTQRKFIWPARHYASSITDPDVPPMGQRFRLKASFDLSGYSPQTQIILQALKTYGMFLADNGSDWFISGAPGACWDDERLGDELRTVKGADFEAVDQSSLMVNPDSAQVSSETPDLADLTLRLSQRPRIARRGRLLSYQVTVTNAGPATAVGVEITVNLPISFSFANATTGCTYANGRVTCPLNTLTQNEVLTLEIRVRPTQRGRFDTTARATSATADPNPDNNEAALTTRVARARPSRDSENPFLN